MADGTLDNETHEPLKNWHKPPLPNSFPESMSVTCKIHLPHAVKVMHVADAIGILSGLRPITAEDGFVRVPGVSIVQIRDVVQLANIQLRGALIGDRSVCNVFYHFEGSDKEFSRLLTPPSSPYWLAIGKGLVDFFGGRLVYRDDLTDYPDLVVPTVRPLVDLGDDDDYFITYISDIFKLRPLSHDDLDRMRNFAAYVE